MNKIYLLPCLCLLFACNKVKNNDVDNTITASCCTTYVEPKVLLTLDSLKAPNSRLTYSESSEWVEPKEIENTVYFYFQLKNEKARNMRMRIEYLQEQYENVNKYEFVVDGETFEYTANKNRSSEYRKIFYWYDHNVSQSDVKLIEALADAKEVKVNLVDKTRGVIATLPLSVDTRQDIKLVYDYYQSMGGAKIPRKGMVNVRQ